MPRPRSANDTSIRLQLPGDWLDEAEAVARAMSADGITVARADVLRNAIRRGLDEIAREQSARRPRR